MLVIDDLTVRIAGRALLENASARIVPGARVGLVGRNGSGKTTLFNVIAGDLSHEQGSIELPPRWRIGRLAQEAPNGPESLLEVVLKADRERSALLAEAETAHDPHRIAEIQTRLADMGAHAAPARAAAILSGLGFSNADQARPCAEFSGGWRMRVALAATLFAEPDLLMLDEPTNYLDLEGTLWLQDHLARYPHTMMIISHDRDLLDNAVDQILSLEAKKLTLYRGGYSDFERQRSERLLLDQKLIKKQEAQRKHLQAFVDRFRAKATKARQAQSRIKMLAKMQPINALVTDEVRPIHFPAPPKALSPPIIATDEVAVGYEPGHPVLSDLSLRIDNDDRIALLGSNGNGKSTLVKLLAGRLKPEHGTVTRAATLRVGYFAQHQLDELDEERSPYDHVRDLMPDQPEVQSARARRRHRVFGACRQQCGENAFRRREVAAAAGARDLRRAAAHHPRRADQPSRHRQPRRADRGDQRLSRRRDPGVARPLSLGSLRRPALAGRRRQGRAVRRRSRRLPAHGARRREPGNDGRLENRRRGLIRCRPAAPRPTDAWRPRRLRKRISQAEVVIAQLTRQLAKLDTTLADGALFASDPARAAELVEDPRAGRGGDCEGGRGMARRQYGVGDRLARPRHCT